MPAPQSFVSISFLSLPMIHLSCLWIPSFQCINKRSCECFWYQSSEQKNCRVHSVIATLKTNARGTNGKNCATRSRRHSKRNQHDRDCRRVKPGKSFGNGHTMRLMRTAMHAVCRRHHVPDPQKTQGVMKRKSKTNSTRG